MKSELLWGVAVLSVAVGCAVSAGHSVINLQASPDAPVSSSAAPPPPPASQAPETGGSSGGEGGGGGAGGG